MRIDFSPRAQRDLDSIFRYIEVRSPQAAVSVLKAIRRRTEAIANFPEIGPRTRFLGIRSVPVSRYPYRIYYRVDSGRIAIVHIRHTSRRPWRGGED